MLRPRSLAVAALAVALLAPATAGARPEALKVLGRRQLDARLVELTLRTGALSRPTRVRVLLPRGYGSSTLRYPVLYLLHGANDDYRSWTRSGDAERLTDGLGLIVVMPDTGRIGGYTDWFNGGRGGWPRWESYHLGQLLPFIDRRFRTVASRRGRAVAGLSMGGFGAMSYAARHPDLFAAAASFSGVVDSRHPGYVATTPAAVFGPLSTQEVRWRGHNPLDLAANLRGLRLVVRTGNGRPGGPFGGGDGIEQVVHAMGVYFHARLRRLGIAHVWDDYGPGGHTWPYWRHDLRRTLPLLMRAFARPPAPPRAVSYRSIEPAYTVYGWRVALARPALEFSALDGADRSGFVLRGSGRATVTTPALYRPGGRLLATIATRGARRRSTVVANPQGRLTLNLTLGPGNPGQQYRFGARTRVFRAVVRLRTASSETAGEG
jgi:S-formylglutathione hydrolase FrmB